MSQNRQDFQVTAQTAKTVYFSLTQGSDPLDLTNVPLRWRLSAAIDDATANLEKGNTAPLAGLTVSNPTQGQCEVAIGDADITDYGLFWHFLEGNLGGSGWVELARGRVVVNPSIGPAATA